MVKYFLIEKGNLNLKFTLTIIYITYRSAWYPHLLRFHQFPLTEETENNKIKFILLWII